MPKLLISHIDRLRSHCKTDLRSGCWIWIKAVDKEGYGHFKADGKDYQAHRFSYENFVGKIPPGLTIDHLCRNESCVNPEHLEPVTVRENILRGNGITARESRQTHCKRQHPFDNKNTMLYRGRRYCRACGKLKCHKYYMKTRGR